MLWYLPGWLCVESTPVLVRKCDPTVELREKRGWDRKEKCLNSSECAWCAFVGTVLKDGFYY